MDIVQFLRGRKKKSFATVEEMYKGHWAQPAFSVDILNITTDLLRLTDPMAHCFFRPLEKNQQWGRGKDLPSPLFFNLRLRKK